MSNNDQYYLLENKLGYTFKDKNLLSIALIHPSCISKTKSDSKLANYERLEFLGDSVLSLICADLLYHQYPEDREGVLTRYKGILENKHFLAELSKKLGLNTFLILDHSAALQGVGDNPSVLENVLEAVVGAIYLDGGYSVAKNIVTAWYGNDIHLILSQHNLSYNPKGEIQEYYQKGGHVVDVLYELQDTIGPDHRKEFFVLLKINGAVMGSGHGYSKKQAEEAAALNALQKLNHIQ